MLLYSNCAQRSEVCNIAPVLIRYLFCIVLPDKIGFVAECETAITSLTDGANTSDLLHANNDALG